MDIVKTVIENIPIGGLLRTLNSAKAAMAVVGMMLVLSLDVNTSMAAGCVTILAATFMLASAWEDVAKGAKK